MKEIVVRAIIKTERVVNTGYIHIRDDSIEGIFTQDYVRIFFTGNNMFLKWFEFPICLDILGYILEGATGSYRQSCKHSKLTYPNTYFLHNVKGELLTLILEEEVENSFEVSQILMNINHVRK